MRLWFLLLLGIMGAASQGKNMDGQVFLFGNRSATNYVTLKQEVTSLSGFTACVRTFTELTAEYSLLSCNSPSQDNNLLLFHKNSLENPYALHVGGQETLFKATTRPLDRSHVCGTWDSFTGVMQLFLNGKPLARKAAKRGYTIKGPLNCVLGQEQDSFGGSFDINQSLAGEIDNVHVWDHVLSAGDIHQAFVNNKHLNGNVMSWRSLGYDISGDVLVEPVQQSVCDKPESYDRSPRCEPY